jgi:hypothetical protein
MNFKAHVDKSAVYISKLNDYFHNDLDFDVTDTSFDIEYHIHIHVRPHGIERIDVDIDSIKGAIDWTVDKDDLSTDFIKRLKEDFGGLEGLVFIFGTIYLDIKPTEVEFHKGFTFLMDEKKEWKIYNEIEFESDGQLLVDNLDINFEEKIITVATI